jgi:flagellar L-ring protein precursor FlgH
MGGCTYFDKEKVTKPKEEDSFPDLSIAEPTSLGSLWEEDNGRAYMFEDLRARQLGDIVIVKIVEQHSGSKSANTTADRESSYEASLLGSVFGLSNFGTIFPDELSGDGVGVQASTENEFEGSGSTSRQDTLTGTIGARVIEVMPNGDLRIKGKREVTVNSEKQTMTLAGIVRRIDLDTTNTVLSTAIAQAEIEYTGLGVVDEVQRPGWLVRIMNWISPF